MHCCPTLPGLAPTCCLPAALMATLPGIDANDEPKSLAAFRFYCCVLGSVGQLPVSFCLHRWRQHSAAASCCCCRLLLLLRAGQRGAASTELPILAHVPAAADSCR